MKSRALLFSALLSLGTHWLFAQGQVASGTVRDAATGDPLPGVAILEKGTTNGVVSDFTGRFEIRTRSASPVLVFQFLGMQTQEMAAGSNMSVGMAAAENRLGEVSVSALGLKQDRDKQSTSSTNVAGDLLQKSGESGLIQGLSGKSSGLTIVRNTGDPGAGANIQIRGQSTITGNLQPLIVVDGVPITSTSYGNSINYFDQGGAPDGVVQQSRLNDINPDDIESVEVLKGAAASAVWGTRAANGVIVITTKRGKAQGDKRFTVDLRSTVGFDFVNLEYEKQDRFGNGLSGNFIRNNALSWGDKISTRAGGADVVANDPNDPLYLGYFQSPDGRRYYRTVTKNDRTVFNDVNRDQVFRKYGFTWDNSIGISAALDKSNVFFSVSDWNQQGILAGNSDYRRTTTRVNFTSALSNSLSFSMNAFYARITSDRIQQGSNLNGLYLGYLRTPADFDNTSYIGTYFNTGGLAFTNAHRGYRNEIGGNGTTATAPTYNNPGWTLNEQINTSDVDRFLINPQFEWKWFNNSSITARAGIDLSNDNRITFFPYRSAGSTATGSYRNEVIQDQQIQLEVFARTTNRLTEDVTLTWILGYQQNNRRAKQLGATITNFINLDDQILNFDNATQANSDAFNLEQVRANSAGYAVLNFGIWDKLFLDATVRTERASTFNGQVWYPSLSAAYLLHKDLNLDPSGVSFLKLRASYGMVGVEPIPYVTRTYYTNIVPTSGWGEFLDPALFGGSINESTVAGNPDIKPEIKTEWEFGADVRFLNDKLGLGITYYTNTTRDVIFAKPVPASSGFGEQWDNAATISNNGLEIDATYEVFRNEDWRVNVFANYSFNRNLVEDMAGVESIFLNGFTGTSSRAVAGQAMGALWGGRWDRDDQGNLLLDANGFPVAAATEGVIGDPNPEWRGGLGANVGWKNFNFSFLFETMQGQDMWAGTEGVLKYFGTDVETANEVTVSAADAAVIRNVQGQTIDQLSYAQNNGNGTYTVRGNLDNFGGGTVLLDQWWYLGNGGGFGPVAEQFIKDGSWTRLREVTLTYDIPKSVFKNKLTYLQVGVTGRNLILWTPFKGVDPELNLTGSSNGRGLDYFTNPGTKSVLATIKLGF
jgi:TonB-linked SusC/RagA family outer membrane protein